MRVAFNNRRIVFVGPASIFRALDERTAFRVAGFMFSKLWRMKVWDGREHLVKEKKDRTTGAKKYEAPIGLLGDLLAIASAEDVEIVEVQDDRRRPGPRVVFSKWNPKYQPRDYQQAAVDEIVKDRGATTGKGLIRIPTRGGKSVIMALAIHTLGVRTVVLVQSQMLLEQTVILFEDALGIKVGRIGRGIWDPGPVTIASCQTLSRRAKNPETLEFLRSVDFAVFDEVHHLVGDSWRAILDTIDAYYKVGFSATIYLSKKKESPQGTIWARAVTGPVLLSREPSDLIRAGWLLQPSVELVRVEGPKIEAEGWAEVYQWGIVDHEVRNQLVIDAAVRHHGAGLQVLVVAERVEHSRALTDLLRAAGVRAEVVTGTTPAGERREIIRRYAAREIDALVGTVFGEAVDIPAIEAVVNAEGGKSQIAAMQRFRCLTPSQGKDTAILTDFMDLHHPMLAKHSLERMNHYREHEMFRLKVV